MSLPVLRNQSYTMVNLDSGWYVLGNRVADSTIDMDVTQETTTDILLNQRTEVQNVTKSQTLENFVETGDELATELDRIEAMGPAGLPLYAQFDVVEVKGWIPNGGGFQALRYPQSTIVRTSLGGPGEANNLTQSVDVTFGGNMEVGVVNLSNGQHGATVTFTPSASMAVAPMTAETTTSSKSSRSSE